MKMSHYVRDIPDLRSETWSTYVTFKVKHLCRGSLDIAEELRQKVRLHHTDRSSARRTGQPEEDGALFILCNVLSEVV
jgi:hypothetical protein